jgi:hypothetical protein
MVLKWRATDDRAGLGRGGMRGRLTLGGGQKAETGGGERKEAVA